MQAIKLMLETDENGNLVALPKLPARARIEAIFLILDAESASKPREPPPEIARRGRIVGDILSPVVPEDDWEVLR